MATKETIRFGLEISRDTIKQSRAFGDELWIPVMKAIEGAPNDLPTVFHVGTRDGLFWPFEGDPEDLAAYLKKKLKSMGYDMARVELAPSIRRADPDEEPATLALGPEPSTDEPEKADEPPNAKDQLRSLRQAWDAKIMPRTQAVRRVAQIVRSKDNDLEFGDGALDALIRNIEGLI